MSKQVAKTKKVVSKQPTADATSAVQEKTPITKRYVIDAENLILGRLSAEAAAILLCKKPTMVAQALHNNNNNIEIHPTNEDMVYVINAEKAIISGNPKQIVQRYLQRIDIKTNTNPRRGPFMPRTPEKIFDRAVRGMLPLKNHGKSSTYTRHQCMHRFRVYCGVPAFLADDTRLTFDKANAKKFTNRRISVGDLAQRIGTFQNNVRAGLFN